MMGDFGNTPGHPFVNLEMEQPYAKVYELLYPFGCKVQRETGVIAAAVTTAKWNLFDYPAGQ
jgi:hypothetical protein